MTIRRPFLCLVFLAVLPACHVTPPAVPLTEVPAAPFTQALHEQQQSFIGLKAVARAEVERRGRRRAYESVAIILRGQERMRIEGYGPIGDTLFVLLWDGTDVLVRRAEDGVVRKAGAAGLERLTGIALAPSDICAVLSGTLPRMPDTATADAGCSAAGWCIVDFRYDDTRWSVKVTPPATPAGRMRIDRMQLFRGGKEQFVGTYAYGSTAAGPEFPSTVTLADPGGKGQLTVQYQDVEVNAAADDGSFRLEEGSPR